MSGKISQDTTVPYKAGIFVPGIDMTLGVGSQNVKLLASSFIGATFITPQQFGAMGDGITDDTAAFQAAVTAAGVGGTWKIPPGTYKLSATVRPLAGQQIIGSGPNNTIITRTTDYGDTFLFASAVGVAVKGVWFQHSTMYGLSDTSLANRITSNSAHIRLQGAQGVLIEDCWIWRLPYQIAIDSGSLVKIHRCHAQGTWDPNFVAAQEGIAGIQVGGTGYTQIVAVEHCYMAGSGNGPRNTTFTSADTGAHVFSITANCGNKYGIEIIQCEDLLVSNTYIGGNSTNNIASLPVGGSVNLDWRFVGNFFDGAGLAEAMVSFKTQADNTYPTNVTISGNCFHGELQTQNAIVAQNPAGDQPTLTNFAITGNSFMATVGSAMMFLNARGGTISGNSITSYNARNVSGGADLSFCAAAYFAAHAFNIIAQGNLAGGSTTAVDTPSFCYRDFYLAGAPGSVVAINNLIVAGGAAGTTHGLHEVNVVTHTVAGNYTMLGNEDVVIVNKSVGASTQVFLPTDPPPGFMVTVKDGKGDAATNPIQLVGTVDGVVNPAYNVAFFQRKVVWNGSAWNVIGS